MSCCSRHHQSSDRHHRNGEERPGVVRRVTRGLAKKFGVPRKLVLAGFIVGLIINVPLTIFIFLVALYWVDHPGKLESKLENLAEKSRRFWSGFGSPAERPAYAGPANPERGGAEVDFTFSELRQQFEDLERRAGDMEAHVSADEFHLNKEIDGMRKKGTQE